MEIATSSAPASGWRPTSSSSGRRPGAWPLLLPACLAAALLLATGGAARCAQEAPAESVATLLAAARVGPPRADLLARLSQAWSRDVDALAKKKKNGEAEHAARSAVETAERAVQTDPACAEAHLALAIACGKLTDFVDNSTKMALSRRIRDEAQQTLALNPKSDLAHHILGRWNYGIATLNPMLKLAARVVYGALPPASLAKAANQLEQAAALNPKKILHHHHLALVYRALGEKEKEKGQWKLVLQLPAADEEDAAAQKEARKALQP